MADSMADSVSVHQHKEEGEEKKLPNAVEDSVSDHDNKEELKEETPSDKVAAVFSGHPIHVLEEEVVSHQDTDSLDEIRNEAAQHKEEWEDKKLPNGVEDSVSDHDNKEELKEETASDKVIAVFSAHPIQVLEEEVVSHQEADSLDEVRTKAAQDKEECEEKKLSNAVEDFVSDHDNKEELKEKTASEEQVVSHQETDSLDEVRNKAPQHEVYEHEHIEDANFVGSNSILGISDSLLDEEEKKQVESHGDENTQNSSPMIDVSNSTPSSESQGFAIAKLDSEMLTSTEMDSQVPTRPQVNSQDIPATKLDDQVFTTAKLESVLAQLKVDENLKHALKQSLIETDSSTPSSPALNHNQPLVNIEAQNSNTDVGNELSNSLISDVDSKACDLKNEAHQTGHENVVNAPIENQIASSQNSDKIGDNLSERPAEISGSDVKPTVTKTRRPGSIPSYMAPTESAKAKLRISKSMKPLSTDHQVPDKGITKRRNSVSDPQDHKLQHLSPRTQRLLSDARRISTHGYGIHSPRDPLSATGKQKQEWQF